MDVATIRPALNTYLDTVKKHFRISEAFLFGSLAQGKLDPHDIDLIILSDDFASLDADERSRLLYRASVGFPYDLHVFGLTPDEYTQASPLTSLGAIRHSQTVKIA